MSNMKMIFEVFPELETVNFKLRQIIQGDSKDILEIFSDEQVVKYQGLPPMSCIEDAAGYISWADEGYNEKSLVRWAIEDKITRKVIGLMGIYYLNEKESKAEVSYNLNRSYWRKGIMREALEEFLMYMCDVIKLGKIEATIDINNYASIKFAEKMGFKKGEVQDNEIHYFYEK